MFRFSILTMKLPFLGLFFTLFLIAIPLCDAEGKIEKICPLVLPDGPAPLKDPSEAQPRIINGDIAPKLRHFMGALKLDGELDCSATLLSEYWALTAAHCMFDPNTTTLVIGGSKFDNGEEIEIEKGIVHELFPAESATNIINDILLIKLKSPAPPTTKFVKLNANPSIPASYSFVRTAGYGDTLGTAFPKSGVLRQVDLPVQPMNVCKKQYYGVNVLQRYHICAGYVRGGCDSCSGDSGGPLFIFDEDLNVVQVGIVSFGYECAIPDASGVYSKVSSQINWLRKQGAVFQASTSGVNVFADPVTGTPLGDGEEVEAEITSSPALEDTQDMEFMVSDGNSKSTSEGECFPSKALVTLEDGSRKEMGDLEIGDSVQVGPAEFSKVFMFTHRVRQGTYKFVKIANSVSEDALLVTSGHLMSINGVYKAAEMARIGDIVHLGDGGKAEIVNVELVLGNGLYNPQTVDGRVVVNDIIVSTYTTALDLRTAHAVLVPFRYAFMVFREDLSCGVFEGGVGFGIRVIIDGALGLILSSLFWSECKVMCRTLLSI